MPKGNAKNLHRTGADNPDQGRRSRTKLQQVQLVRKLISGGQTGADRAALDWAIEHRLPHGGWCPRGRKAEDGPIDKRYLLKETPSDDYAERTEWNVRDADGTVAFSIKPMLAGGTFKTVRFAAAQGKPWVHICAANQGRQAAGLLRKFLQAHRIQVLNIAGPRASDEPEVGRFVRTVLSKALLSK